MDEMKFCPLQEGYSFTVGNDVKEQELAGGLPRQVKQFVGSIHNVTAQILLRDQLERQIFWAFWRINQTKLWWWRLVLDNGDLEDCVCQFNNSTVPSETLIEGRIRKIQISIRVVPIKRYPDFDKWLIEQWQNGKLQDISYLEKIPNVWMPAATGV